MFLLDLLDRPNPAIEFLRFEDLQRLSRVSKPFNAAIRPTLAPGVRWRRDMKAVFDDLIELQRELAPDPIRQTFAVTGGRGMKIMHTTPNDPYMTDLVVLGNITLFTPDWEWADTERTILLNTSFTAAPNRALVLPPLGFPTHAAITVGDDTDHGTIVYEFHGLTGTHEYAGGVRAGLKDIGFY